MDIRFLPEGGFGKAGGFIEVEAESEPTGKETVYQRQGFLEPKIECHNIHLTTSLDIARPDDRRLDSSKVARRTISADGFIEDSRWGSFSFSLLGSSKLHSKLDVMFVESEIEDIVAAGNADDKDFESPIVEGFFLQFYVPREKFAEILAALSVANVRMFVSAEFGLFQGFFAEWSPLSIEGRPIKYLNSVQDVQNAKEVPKEFLGHIGQLEPKTLVGHGQIQIGHRLDADSTSGKGPMKRRAADYADLNPISNSSGDNLALTASFKSAARWIGFGLVAVAVALVVLAGS